MYKIYVWMSACSDTQAFVALKYNLYLRFRMTRLPPASCDMWTCPLKKWSLQVIAAKGNQVQAAEDDSALHIYILGLSDLKSGYLCFVCQSLSSDNSQWFHIISVFFPLQGLFITMYPEPAQRWLVNATRTKSRRQTGNGKPLDLVTCLHADVQMHVFTD